MTDKLLQIIAQSEKKRPRKNNFKTAGDHLKDVKAADQAIGPLEVVKAASEPLEDVTASIEAGKSQREISKLSVIFLNTSFADEASEPLEDVKAAY